MYLNKNLDIPQPQGRRLWGTEKSKGNNLTVLSPKTSKMKLHLANLQPSSDYSRNNNNTLNRDTHAHTHFVTVILILTSSTASERESPIYQNICYTIPTVLYTLYVPFNDSQKKICKILNNPESISSGKKIS